MAEADRLRLSLVQRASVLGDVGANLAWTGQLIREEAESGTDLVLFPELSLTGYVLQDLVESSALRADGPELTELARLCDRTTAVVGLVLESDDYRFFNAAAVLGRGRVLQLHRKVYLPTYGIFDEQRYLAAGDRFEAFSLELGEGRAEWRLGVCICEDLWHPSAPYLLSLQAVDAILCPSASPGRGVSAARGQLGSAASYSALLRTYAELFTTYVAYCNRVGVEDGLHFWGGSRVVGPDGELLSCPAGADPGVARYELDRRALRRARVAYPLLRDERPEVVLRQLAGRDRP